MWNLHIDIWVKYLCFGISSKSRLNIFWFPNLNWSSWAPQWRILHIICSSHISKLINPNFMRFTWSHCYQTIVKYYKTWSDKILPIIFDITYWSFMIWFVNTYPSLFILYNCNIWTIDEKRHYYLLELFYI